MQKEKIIDGKKIAERIKDEIVEEIKKINNFDKSNSLNKRPSLAIILIGNREDSKLYVDIKEREAKKVGIDTHLYKCSENIEEQEVFDMISCLNNDKSIDAILVQLPLPKNFDTDGIIAAINPKKDVDRFHPENLEALFKSCDHQHVIPPVFEAILEMLKEIKYNPKNKNICIVGNSKIFGLSLAKTLECLKAKVSTTNTEDKNLKEKTQKADVLITAVGKPHFIKKEMVKKDSIIIDIGITKKDGKIYGDVDFENVFDKVAYITPVPGGVGPLTIAMLFKNTLSLFK